MSTLPRLKPCWRLRYRGCWNWQWKHVSVGDWDYGWEDMCPKLRNNIVQIADLFSSYYWLYAKIDHRQSTRKCVRHLSLNFESPLKIAHKLRVWLHTCPLHKRSLNWFQNYQKSMAIRLGLPCVWVWVRPEQTADGVDNLMEARQSWLWCIHSIQYDAPRCTSITSSGEAVKTSISVRRKAHFYTYRTTRELMLHTLYFYVP